MKKGDHRGAMIRMKFWLYEHVSPELVVKIGMVFNRFVRWIPYRWKYGLTTRSRRNSFPYRLVRDGDVVVQVGAPSDTLHAGRSRAANFAHFVGSGTLVVVEADAQSCEDFRAFAKARGFADRCIVIESGAWHEKTELVFLSSRNHPTASVLVDAKRKPELRPAYLGFEEQRIAVDTIDQILEGLDLPAPRLLSVTTNGAELQIIGGAEDTLGACRPYVSLARTGPGYVEAMAERGYVVVSTDDRGTTFAPKDDAVAPAR